ncbi:MAG: hypothetical protein H8D05_01025 [FCB group bacterium]|nr:hypothetical protein [FCB group bacterium]
MRRIFLLLSLSMLLSCGTVVIPEYVDIIGTYSGTVSSVLGLEQSVTINLNDDHSAEMIMGYSNCNEVTIETGTWLTGEDGFIDVIFNKTMDIPMYPEERFVFELKGNSLYGVEYDEVLYGTDGFVLNRI